MPPTMKTLTGICTKKYKAEVCDRVPAFTVGGEDADSPAWSDTITESEILELSFINMAYGLHFKLRLCLPS